MGGFHPRASGVIWASGRRAGAAQPAPGRARRDVRARRRAAPRRRPALEVPARLQRLGARPRRRRRHRGFPSEDRGRSSESWISIENIEFV